MKYLLVFMLCLNAYGKVDKKISLSLEKTFADFQKLSKKTKKADIESIFTARFIKGYGGVDKLKKQHLDEILAFQTKDNEIEIKQGTKDKNYIFVRFKSNQQTHIPNRWYIMKREKDGKLKIDTFIGDLED